MIKSLATAALAASALTLSSCGGDLGKEPELRVASGYIEMGATPDRPAAGYFTILGGPRDVDLVAVTADPAQRVEINERVREHAVATRKTLTSDPVPAQGQRGFTPGSH